MEVGATFGGRPILKETPILKEDVPKFRGAHAKVEGRHYYWRR